jgi:hypothetical protein
MEVSKSHFNLNLLCFCHILFFIIYITNNNNNNENTHFVHVHFLSKGSDFVHGYASLDLVSVPPFKPK